MPFTVSHIVAAVPFNKRLAKYTALSPLIIGSMTPDVSYLIPQLLHQRLDSHSLLGVYLFCIPMGLTIYYLYHLLIAPVVVSFLPKTIQRHLNPDLFIGKLPKTAAHVLLISLVIGALTHVIWDFFTHQSGIPRHVGWMDTPLSTIDGYDIMPYRVLQHLSSILGLVLLFYWIFIWHRRNKSSETQHHYWQAPRKLKLFTLLFIALASLLVALANGFINLPETDVLFGLYSAQVFIRHALVAGMGAFLLSCIGMGFLYRLRIKAADLKTT